MQKGKTFTLYVSHNGPLDIDVRCQGRAKNRLNGYKEAAIHAPAIPPRYDGPFQYEAENFDYKGITANITNGIGKPIRDYTAQGYLDFGGQADAAIRKTVHAIQNGVQAITLRYKAPDGARPLRLSVNGRAQAIELPATRNGWWGTVTVNAEFLTGDNLLEIAAVSASEYSLLLDNVIIR